MLRTILAIETSMDDTCAAVVQETRVLSNVIASQTAFHAEFGGTVPHIAKRKHEEWIDKTIEEALRRAQILQPPPSPPYKGGVRIIDAVAVTYGPGLAPCLEVGIAKAKELVNKWQVPLIAVNHMEGHLLSSMAENSKGKGPLSQKKLKYPILGLLISGGHTQLVLMRKWREYEIVGETLDDAIGEAYDKVARMLRLGYPGGPILSELAKYGKPIYSLPEPMVERKDLHFSFSGLKTACNYYLKEHQPELTREFCQDFAASFEAVVVKMMSRRLRRAIELYQPTMVWLGGGVVSNVTLRQRIRGVARKCGVPTYIPYSAKLFTDNAAMIGVTAYFQAQPGEVIQDVPSLDRVPNLRLGSK